MALTREQEYRTIGRQRLDRLKIGRQGCGVTSSRQIPDLGSLFLSPRGRMDRRPFIVGVVVLVAALAVFQWLAVGTWWHVPVGWVVYPLLIYGAVCVIAKRLHDRGRSGWLAPLVLLGFNAVWPYPDSLTGLVGTAILIWAAIELGWLRGEEGANRHGPPLPV